MAPYQNHNKEKTNLTTKKCPRNKSYNICIFADDIHNKAKAQRVNYCNGAIVTKQTSTTNLKIQ